VSILPVLEIIIIDEGEDTEGDRGDRGEGDGKVG